MRPLGLEDQKPQRPWLLKELERRVLWDLIRGAVLAAPGQKRAAASAE